MYEEIRTRFFEGIRKGKFEPWTSEEVDDLIERKVKSQEPLAELSSPDAEVIFSVLKTELQNYLNSSTYQVLVSDPLFYFAAPEDLPADMGSLISRSEILPYFFGPVARDDAHSAESYRKDLAAFDATAKILMKNGIQPLSTAEKENLLRVPEVWERTKLRQLGWMFQSSFHLLGYGMRSLGEYGMNDEEFLATVERIKNATGKKEINLLDVGGAVGIALRDAGKLSKDVKTHNLTTIVEPTMFPVDGLYVHPAERMPAEFREQMDLVISNWAFLYFAGQNLALENILQSLSVGGEAQLNIAWGKQKAFVPDFSRRMANQYRRLQKLHDKKIIELEVRSGSHGNALDFPVDPQGKFYPPAVVRIKKKKSLSSTSS